MGITEIITVALVGLIAGFLAGRLWRGRGFGLIGDLAVGVAGSFLGRFLFQILHIQLPFHWIINSIIMALGGALILLVIIKIIRRA